ncbi:MAG: hypothetical protein QW590_00060 [Candidatus Bilamarchaeaceae archaeon]
MSNNEEEEIVVRRREKREPPIEDEQVDIELEQNESGADVDRIANFIWELSREVVYLEDLVEGWENADDEKDKREIEENLPDQMALVLDRLKRLDEFRVRFGKDAPSADEYEMELRARAERLIKEAKAILKKSK